ncbi:hypothetical protein KBP46_10055 [Chryseobacterium sp. PCH239]|uniref:hypothetical protein n=1 Tax=Chryseobacterium sp. PCH239 TaxID=2825845 RepID=UPI001C11B1E9|nr:hypothetical protein [Chryseobacterium sp. PCH239]QWT88139.1 hypothetical protein KBP46_10055 [Chryseobacterium sp. PCH239]
MKNTKYIKVSVSERHPEESKYYETNIGRLFYNPVMKEFENEVFNPMKIDYWLEEKPDYEDEMKEVLLQLVGCHTCGHTIPDWLNDRAEELITKLK